MTRHVWPAHRPVFQAHREDAPPVPPRENAIGWLRHLWVRRWGVVVLRFVDPAEPRVFEICVMDGEGNILLLQQVDPGIPLGPGAHLRDSDVVGMLRWPPLRRRLARVRDEHRLDQLLAFDCRTAEVITYNDRLWRVQNEPMEVVCVRNLAAAMLESAPQSLVVACQELAIPVESIDETVEEASAIVALIETLFVSW